MSNIDKRALREAAEKALPAMKRLLMMPNDELFDEALLNVDGDVDAANAFNLLTGPETVLALLDELEAKDKQIAELESDNAYIRNRYKELDLLIGKNILVMQAAIIEWQGTGDAKNGLAWYHFHLIWSDCYHRR